MNVAFTPELEHWIKGKVKSGLYQSADEVIVESVRMLYSYEEQERLRRQQWLRQQLTVGLNQLDQGQARPFDEQLVAAIKKNGRRRRGKARV